MFLKSFYTAVFAAAHSSSMILALKKSTAFINFLPPPPEDALRHYLKHQNLKQIL